MNIYRPLLIRSTRDGRRHELWDYAARTYIGPACDDDFRELHQGPSLPNPGEQDEWIRTLSNCV